MEDIFDNAPQETIKEILYIASVIKEKMCDGFLTTAPNAELNTTFKLFLNEKEVERFVQYFDIKGFDVKSVPLDKGYQITIDWKDKAINFLKNRNFNYF